MAESLLNKALKDSAGRHQRDYTLEEEELCLAWLNNEIGLQQVARAIERPASQQVYVFLARCSRQIFLKSRPKKK